MSHVFRMRYSHLVLSTLLHSILNQWRAFPFSLVGSSRCPSFLPHVGYETPSPPTFLAPPSQLRLG